MILFFRKKCVPVIVFVVSIVFIGPYLMEGGIMANGESSIYLNPSFYDYYSTWEDKINFGIFSPHQSNIYLFSLFWKLFSVFAGTIHPSMVFIFLSVFLSSLFLYFCLDQILRLENKFIYLPACLLYSFNVFRILGPLNERLNLLFIFLPLFFLFYYKLLQTQKWKYVFWIVVISILSSSMGANLPVFFIPYLLMLLYLAYFFVTEKEIKLKWKNILLKNVTLFILIVIGNLFWISPLLKYLSDLYLATNQGRSLWSATGAGTFVDHFRFLGSWAWEAGNNGVKYYPFSKNYNNPLLLLSTYFIAILSFVYAFAIKKREYQALKMFILLLSGISFLLLAGNKGSLGFIFDVLYEKVAFFRMYREPFTKFMPLYIFATSFGLVFSLLFLERFMRRKFGLFIFFASVVILVNAYPLFTTESMPIHKWSSGRADFIVKVPDHWSEVNKIISENNSNSRVMLFPYNVYGMSYNWQQGASVSGNIGDYLLENNVARAIDIDKSNAGVLLKSIFETTNLNADLGKFLGLFNIKFVLQENDAEWRYHKKKIWPPSKSNAYLESKGLEKVGEFGKFTPELLNEIEKKSKGRELKKEVRAELDGQPALSLYSVDEKKIFPSVYAPKKYLISQKEYVDLIQEVSINNFNDEAFIILFSRQNDDKLAKNRWAILDSMGKVADINKNLDRIEFRKINSTKYKIKLHGAKNNILIVLSESFNDGWKVYFKKNETLNDVKSIAAITDRVIGLGQSENLSPDHFYETWLAGRLSNDEKGLLDLVYNRNVVGLSEDNHLMANGYANSWVINVDDICHGADVQDGAFCVKNADGSYDLELIAEFEFQKFFYLGFAASVFIMAVCLIFLIIEMISNYRK